MWGMVEKSFSTFSKINDEFQASEEFVCASQKFAARFNNLALVP
jgi:hypothetical protein